MEQENKSQLWIWISISVATILVVLVAVYFVLNKIDPKEADNSLKQDSPTFSENYLDSVRFEIDLQKNYVGTKTDENGSISALLLSIKNLNRQMNSYDYDLNIGVSTRNSASGTVDFNRAIIYSSEFGELEFHVDSIGRIHLNNKEKNVYPKYDLSEEIK